MEWKAYRLSFEIINKSWRMAYVWWKKAKELEEELLALQEKQNRLQEQISNIAKSKRQRRRDIGTDDDLKNGTG